MITRRLCGFVLEITLICLLGIVSNTGFAQPTNAAAKVNLFSTFQ